MKKAEINFKLSTLTYTRAIKLAYDICSEMRAFTFQHPVYKYLRQKSE